MIQKQARSKAQHTVLPYKNCSSFLYNKDHSNQTNVTCSRAELFNYKHPDNPAPATYNFTNRPQNTIIQGLQPSKEYLWITDKGRQLFKTKNQWKNNLGPGKYPSLCPTQRHLSNWPKCNRFKYEINQMRTIVGPGLYQTGINQFRASKQAVASSAFKSKSTKSYLADKISQLQKKQQINVNPEVELQKIQGPIYLENENHYQRIQSNKKIGSPVFISKCERLPTIQPSNIGPGSYIIQGPHVVQNTRKQSPLVVKRIATEPHITKQNLIQKQHPHLHISAGREIQNQINGVQRFKRKGLLGVIMKEKRFKQRLRQCPGPADYGTIKNIAKTQINVISQDQYKKLRGIDRLIGSVVRKAVTRNRQHTQSHTNIYKLFKHFQTQKETIQKSIQNR